MPVQKRSSNLQEGVEEESMNISHRRKLSRCGGVADQGTTSSRPAFSSSPLPQNQDQEFLGDPELYEKNPEEDSDGSGTDPEDFDEVVAVLRSELRNNDFNERDFFAQLFQARKDVECPICLGIIKKTRTVMGCLHRFCRECIDKSMRLGNNECPACRIHCASRRSLRDDQVFDRLIEAIYPDAQKYEEEEMLFHEEDKTRNEQIKASIAQVSRLQLEASNRRRRLEKDTDGISPIRAPRSCRRLYTRRRNQRSEAEAIENERQNDQDGIGSLNQNDVTEIRQRTQRRQPLTLPTETSLSAPKPDHEFPSIMLRNEEASTPAPVPLYNPEKLTWGRGGARSHPRNGGASTSRTFRGNRVSKLADHLKSVSETEIESDVHFTLVSLDNGRIPSLSKPFFRCQRSLSINKLREHVAQEIGFPAEKIEMLLVHRTGNSHQMDVNSITQKKFPASLSPNVDWSKVKLQILEGEETLMAVSCCSWNEDLILAYRGKKDSSPIYLSP